jgi:hypothetical protein
VLELDVEAHGLGHLFEELREGEGEMDGGEEQYGGRREEKGGR